MGLKRRSNGGRNTGQTPAVEELDHPQEAEGNILSFFNHTVHYPFEGCSKQKYHVVSFFADDNLFTGKLD